MSNKICTSSVFSINAVRVFKKEISFMQKTIWLAVSYIIIPDSANLPDFIGWETLTH